ncbi:MULTISPECIES: NAD(P)/FAD-dependent oxidoreductase [Streptomyces]|uniref:FAD-dependent oxidoreductase n=2 Tax=Streptomyces caniscabiei TaxID=2746961 RepID=A0ABU4N1Q3_9ACTN|nr:MULTISPECIES: FAD-dependent oxidoreductase [Streptomyces]MBE4739695.1 FAD-dependent oxidoreductase [Streptomyces caniscabiei]MBE4760305.1 FAD-dependent oxidoreductase [Streptomyces caniscabiei]MBE4773682.1 FAD-dependent oxidoreductase [Streptomyces caniscabiei]MBE4782625.1 FAD-dependent oxidoreductase [Streptomyces caniscabiei]MBE4791928.1 FAD-dependent oxidoreductase [Streptomyces caniscabiei]
MPDGEVIVIGGGYGGIRLAKQLDETARVTLVDRKEVFFHRIAALRAGVREPWTTTPFIPYDRLLRHGRVVVGKAVDIDTRERQVHLATGERLPYDVVVIATGADYPEPARFLGTTSEEAGKTFAAHQESVAAAEHVLIVGGGPGGVELAAEIRLARPDARVTLAHAGSELLSSTGSKWAGRRALAWLESHDVDVRLDSFVSQGPDFGTYRDGRGGIIEADLSFWANGTTPNTLWLRLAGHGAWLNEGGQVKVDRMLRVDGRLDVFAVGDVNDVSELKVSPVAFAQADIAAHNIRTYLANSGRHRKEPRVYRPIRRTPLIIPLGSADGITLVPMPGGETAVLGSRTSTLAKAKTLMTPYVRRQLGY